VTFSSFVTAVATLKPILDKWNTVKTKQSKQKNSDFWFAKGYGKKQSKYQWCDDDADRMAVRRALKAAGFHLIGWSRRRTGAIAMLHQQPFDCVFRLSPARWWWFNLGWASARFSIASSPVVLTGQGDEKKIAVQLMKAGARIIFQKQVYSRELIPNRPSTIRVHRAEVELANQNQWESEETPRLAFRRSKRWNLGLVLLQMKFSYCNDRLLEIIGVSRSNSVYSCCLHRHASDFTANPSRSASNLREKCGSRVSDAPVSLEHTAVALC